MTDLVLIDGSSYLYRAFHALPRLTNSLGEPTGALHGVLTMIQKLLREERPAHVAVVFDAPGKTFRDELFAEYKATRPPMPDELRSQVQPILDAVEAMGLPLLRVAGVEADDVIGTLCKQAADRDLRVLVSTGDKDLAQLVNDKVTLVNTMNDTRMDRDGVKAKFDVYPEQIVDYLALIGDTSDNIPGVPKVGAKTAAKWLNEYDSADGIVRNADDIKGKVGDSLRENIDQLRLSQQLATIRQDIDLDLGIEDLSPSAADLKRLRELYGHFELRSLLGQLDDGVDAPAAAVNEKSGTDYETVLTWDAFDRWFKKINQAKLTAFDTETTSINYMEAEIVGFSLSVKDNEAAYIPVAHDYPGAPDQLPRDEVLAKMRGWLEDDSKKKVGHHLKYDAHILARYDIPLKGMQYDSMLESYVLNSVATRHDMDSVARQYLGRETIHYEDVAGKGAKQLTFNQVDLESAAPYAAEDADITLQLHEALWKQLNEFPRLKSVYEDIEQPLVPILLAMEETGVLVDRKMLTTQSGELAKKMVELEAKAHKLAGGPFNLGSPKQLQEILFDRLGLPVVRKTPKGQPSTAEDVLVELAEEYDLPAVIIDYRSVSKLKSTYTDKLPLQIDKATGRIHTSYHQAVAATGRLSSTDPNLQNIPIRTPEGRRIRQAFVAPPGQVLLAADYSQIELRIMAHLSADPGLVQAFADELDVHRATAAEVFGMALCDVTDDQRRSAKAINFGLMYGMSAFGLAKQLGISRGEAQEYVNLYFDRYPGVKAFMDAIRDRASKDGYVETVFGRRLYLPEINDRNANRRQYAERTAINAPMQGTAADIIKRAMIAVHAWLNAERPGARMIMQVHDELVFEVDEDKVDAVSERVIELMCAAATLEVPLKVDVGVGMNWDEAH
ncbi:MAG: DNA polymerase I [Gammaproteobacteria bacterium]|nr:DNA polymerase I [Gammaproteobacteria bacterium]MDH5583491.1 DNA polymerase I [Gammaproteobacteria bacterium]